MKDPLDRISEICREQPHDALTRIAEILGCKASPSPEEAKPEMAEEDRVLERHKRLEAEYNSIDVEDRIRARTRQSG